MHDLIVIGGGPAGLAATTYALVKGLDVVLIGTRRCGVVVSTPPGEQTATVASRCGRAQLCAELHTV